MRAWRSTRSRSASVASGRTNRRFAAIVSWNRCASWDTTPTVARNDANVTSRRSVPAMRTAPDVGSYIRLTSCDTVVLPAPDGPTSATMEPAGTSNETSCSVSAVGSLRCPATDSREASDTSSARGYRNVTPARETEAPPAATAVRRSTASGFSATDGSRSSTSSTRSNETSAVITSTWTFAIAVSGPYRRVR